MRKYIFAQIFLTDRCNDGNDIKVLIMEAEISKDVVANGMVEGILYSEGPSIAEDLLLCIYVLGGCEVREGICYPPNPPPSAPKLWKEKVSCLLQIGRVLVSLARRALQKGAAGCRGPKRFWLEDAYTREFCPIR